MKTYDISTKVFAVTVLLMILAVSVFGVFAAGYASNHQEQQSVPVQEVMVFPLIKKNEGVPYERIELDQKEIRELWIQWRSGRRIH